MGDNNRTVQAPVAVSRDISAYRNDYATTNKFVETIPPRHTQML